MQNEKMTYKWQANKAQLQKMLSLLNKDDSDHAYKLRDQYKPRLSV